MFKKASWRVRVATWTTAGYLLASAGLAWGADESIPNFRSDLKQWIEVQKTIQATRRDWDVEKASLSQTIELLESEEARLTQQISELEGATGEVGERRQELTEQQYALNATESGVRERLGKLVAKVRELEQIMPAPLLEKVQPLLRNLRRPGQETSQYVQALLGILVEVDKFNSSFTVAGELVDIAGKQVQVDVVYLGLAQAYYVDRARSRAGVGIPDAEGWKWTARNELAPAITKVLAIYRDERPAEFVPLPATATP